MAGRLCAIDLGLPQIQSEHISFNYVTKLAEARARQPFHFPRAALPDFLNPEHLNEGSVSQN